MAASRQKGSVTSINDTLAIERRGGRDGGAPPMFICPVNRGRRPWNKGLLIGQKKPLEPKYVWSIRVRLEIARSRRDLAIFNLAIDSKLRACDLVKLRVDEICSGANVATPSNHRPKEDRSTCPIRDHGAVEEFRCGLATNPSGYRFQISLPKSTSCKPSYIHPPVCPAGASLG
jgi:hypothetical protein